ncbi:MAG TPA: NAD(P)H-binding protein [Conexibacter sp.]|nr:NAD(P)H-binding protein [Conexibacter sp.]
MRVAVIGGTGGLGRLLAAGLAAHGDEVRAVSRHAPTSQLADGVTHHRADLASGDGLAEAVAGVEVVVDAVNELRRARTVLVGGTRRLLAAEAAAGVGHHVAISIVGCERVPWSYYNAKAAQEDAVTAGPVAWSLLRATQFHTLLAGTFAEAARWRLVPTGRALLQPIDPALVAERLVAAVHAGPAGRLPDLAGPEVRTLTELAAAWRTHDGRRLLGLRVPFVGRVGRALRAGGLTDPAAAAGGATFAQWLATPR